MSFYGDPYGFGGGYGPPSYYPAYPAQYYSSGNTVYHHRRKPPKEKDNVQVWCDVCDVGCIGQQSYIEHCGGRKHQLLERKKAQHQALSSPSPSTPSLTQQEPQRPTTDQPTATTTNTGPSPTVRFSPYESGAPIGAKGSQGKFYCELCKIYSNDQSTFQLHLAGKKHKINVQRQSAASDPYGPNINPISPTSVIHPPRYHIPSSPRTHFTPTLTNTPTNLEDDLLLNSKLESLTPSTSDTLSLRHLVETVTAKLDEFSDKNPASQSQPIVIMETKLVGPYAWGTLLKVNLVADIAVITKEHPTFGTLRFMQQAISSAIPEAQIEIGKDTMDMHIRMAQGTAVHLLFTWVGAWEIGERAEEPYLYPKQEYTSSPSASPSSSPHSPLESPSSPLTFSTHDKTPPGGSWVVKPWATPFTHWPPQTSSSDTASPPLSVAPQIPPTSQTIPPPITITTTSSTASTTSIISTRSPSPVTTSTQIEEDGTLPSTSSSPPGTGPNPAPSQPSTSLHSTDTQEDLNVIAGQRALRMIRQAMWFSHNSLSPNVRQCIKIMKDLRHRHTAFAAVNNWALEVMVVNALRTLPLSASISQSLRAIFAFVASGTLLPGVDLLDPCLQSDSLVVRSIGLDYGSVLQDLTQEDRLAITKAAQKILNDIAFGRWEVIVG